MECGLGLADVDGETTKVRTTYVCSGPARAGMSPGEGGGEFPGAHSQCPAAAATAIPLACGLPLGPGPREHTASSVVGKSGTATHLPTGSGAAQETTQGNKGSKQACRDASKTRAKLAACSPAHSSVLASLGRRSD